MFARRGFKNGLDFQGAQMHALLRHNEPKETPNDNTKDILEGIQVYVVHLALHEDEAQIGKVVRPILGSSCEIIQKCKNNVH